MPNIRKPNGLHKLNGTFREDRHGKKGLSLDDSNIADLPLPPDCLSMTAKAEWVRIVAILSPMKLLKATDYGIMLAYCQIFDELFNPPVDAFGIKTKPLASLYAQFRGIANDLGLTPISRSKISLKDPAEKPDNEYSDF